MDASGPRNEEPGRSPQPVTGYDRLRRLSEEGLTARGPYPKLRLTSNDGNRTLHRTGVNTSDAKSLTLSVRRRGEAERPGISPLSEQGVADTGRVPGFTACGE